MRIDGFNELFGGSRTCFECDGQCDEGREACDGVVKDLIAYVILQGWAS